VFQSTVTSTETPCLAKPVDTTPMASDESRNLLSMEEPVDTQPVTGPTDSPPSTECSTVIDVLASPGGTVRLAPVAALQPSTTPSCVPGVPGYKKDSCVLLSKSSFANCQFNN
jgi:hypothetical protein